MAWMLAHPYTALCYGFLYLTVLLLWYPQTHKIPVWSIGLVISIIFGLLGHRIELLGLIPIILLALVCYLVQKENLYLWLRVAAGILLLFLGVGLETHIIPGFNNLLVLNHVYISQNAVPFTLYLNFDKTLVGIFILGFTLRLISTQREALLMVKQSLPRAFIVILVVALMSFGLGFVQYDPKLSSHLWIWAITNLLFVCLAEEAFFRGFIQRYLSLILQKVKFGQIIAILIASVLFGLAHHAGGPKYMLLATVAGMGYGWVYYKTKRIEASMLTHFVLNLIHFLFFTYPALAIAA